MLFAFRCKRVALFVNATKLLSLLNRKKNHFVRILLCACHTSCLWYTYLNILNSSERLFFKSNINQLVGKSSSYFWKENFTGKNVCVKEVLTKLDFLENKYVIYTEIRQNNWKTLPLANMTHSKLYSSFYIHTYPSVSRDHGSALRYIVI